MRSASPVRIDWSRRRFRAQALPGEPVTISTIGVYGLFDRFNHDIVFNPEERITIIIGPNGFGKTMMLRTLNALFNRPVQTLERMPFKELTVQFSNHSTLRITQSRYTNQRRSGNDITPLQVQYEAPGGEIDLFVPDDRVKEEDLPFPISAIDDFIPNIVRVGRLEWRHVDTDEILDLDDIIAQFGDQLPDEFDVAGEGLGSPPWLEEIKKSIAVRFVHIDRLTSLSQYGDYRRRTRRVNRNYAGRTPQRTVQRYSDNLSRMVQRQLGDYATLSQSLDRSFPARLVAAPTGSAHSGEELAKKLAEVEERRSNIIEAGLLVQDDVQLSIPVISEIDEARRGVLAVYTEDALRKLSVFDDLYARVNVFKTIANERLLYKTVSVSSDGLKVSTVDGSELTLEMLSSGEQHLLVLLYDLLFGVRNNSLLMIDEPELSLHVDWQRAILSDLDEMAKLSAFRVLLATHSPQIIGDRWDLAVQLQGPAE